MGIFNRGEKSTATATATDAYYMNERTASRSGSEKGGVQMVERASSGSSSSLVNNTNDPTYSMYPVAPTDTRLYNADGRVNLIPMPTADPRDPLNFTMKRKYLAIGSLCCFGAMAAAAELILGAMLPVFSFEYAGLDPKMLKDISLPRGANGLSVLANFPGPPIWKIYLLASLPVLVMGIANFFLVPLAISVGRRTVILSCGVAALGGCMWSGFSQSLESHLAARCLQAWGAGTVESLIPYIIQDLVFYHQRNSAIACVHAAQGLIIVALGISSPYIIVFLSWRWVYFMTAAAGVVFWVMMFFVMPETRFYRSPGEERGIPEVPLRPGQDRPDLDFEKHPRPTLRSDLALFTGKMDFRSGFVALWDTFRTFFYPHIFFITMLNSGMIAVTLAAGYTVAAELIVAPYSWPFLHLGFCLIPVIVAAIASYLVSGIGADYFANWMAKKNGYRNPDVQALNLIIPTLFGLIGSLIFGFSGDRPDQMGWPVFLFGFGMIVFGFLATNTIGIVYVLESYPHLAGPSLVNIASFRCLIAFALSFRVSEWVAELGYLKTFIMYGGILGAFIIFIPVVYIFGEGWRKKWPALPKGHAAGSQTHA